MFEGRHQEHLTVAELEQLERFVEEVEHRISLHLYGERKEADDDDGDALDVDDDDADATDSILNDSLCDGTRSIFARKPTKQFQFAEATQCESSNYFSDLYESYRKSYEEKMAVVRNATADFHPVQSFQNMVSDAAAAADIHFHPVQDLRNLMAETGKTIEKAEESAMATATHMYESLVPAGSHIDKQLSAMSHATSVQITEAWNSVKTMSERLETARFLQKQRQRLKQQLKGYRELLKHMRDFSSAVPSKQMAGMMRRITECNEAMERLENRAQTAFVQATGFALNNIPFMPERHKPQRFAKYSADPLLGLATYPLGFHAMMFVITELPLRILMFKRGFERRVMGPVAYYFHPGVNAAADEDSTDMNTNDERDDSDSSFDSTPIVYVHGIGLGLLPYLPLVDALLATGRPILLPEIPYVTGFRPFQSPNGVLSPAVVSSTMTAMLVSHGYLKAIWMGHSYGTSWLSYMCKFAQKTVAALVFIDPICFCLHVPHLTKQFVYLRPDPGTASYMVRTDVIINWTIQRSFPWAWIILFTDQIEVPCVVFLSEKDALVPVTKVVEYFKTKDIPIVDVDRNAEEVFVNGQTQSHPIPSGDKVNKESAFVDDDDASVVSAQDAGADESTQQPKINCTIFRGDGHGQWTDRPTTTIPMIVGATHALCR